MRIFLLRHGETDWNLEGRCQGFTDIDLNEHGIQQAAEIAQCLSKEKIDAIYSSDLKRALRTAEAIRQFHRLEVNVQHDLRELNHGQFEGLTFAQIRDSYPDFMRSWRGEPAEILIPGGERLVDVAQRAWKAMERIAWSHLAHETVVVVSHHFPIVAILCQITGTPLNLYRSFRAEPCGLHGLDYDFIGGWRLAPGGKNFNGSSPGA